MIPSKIAVILSIAAALAITGYIVTLNVKLSSARADALTLTAEVARKDAQIAQAEGEIQKQNNIIESFAADNSSAEILKSDYTRLQKKYDMLATKTADKLGKEPTCEDKLRTIYESQEAFCYER